MGDLLNAATRQLPNSQRVRGRITQSGAAGTTMALGALTGYAESDQSQVSLSRTSTGIYVVTLANFLGNTGSIVGVYCATTTGAAFIVQSAGTPTYSGSTATVTINVFDAAGSAADCAVNFDIEAY